jgi:hypothetical protein
MVQIQIFAVMSEQDEWADPYATLSDAEAEEDEERQDQQPPSSPNVPPPSSSSSSSDESSRSCIARILEHQQETTLMNHDLERIIDKLTIKIRDLYVSKDIQVEIAGSCVVPFDFSTPSPDDLIRRQKRSQIIRSAK